MDIKNCITNPNSLDKDLLTKNSGSLASAMLTAVPFLQRKPRPSWNASHLSALLIMVRFQETQAAPTILTSLQVDSMISQPTLPQRIQHIHLLPYRLILTLLISQIQLASRCSTCCPTMTAQGVNHFWLMALLRPKFCRRRLQTLMMFFHKKKSEATPVGTKGYQFSHLPVTRYLTRIVIMGSIR